MNNDHNSKIVWKLPREQKGRYVEASRNSGETLIQWIERACEERLERARAKESPSERGGLGGD